MFDIAPNNASGVYNDMKTGQILPKCLGELVGAPGFEPGNGGIKIRCLTTWLRPNGRKGRNLLKIEPGSMPENGEIRRLKGPNRAARKQPLAGASRVPALLFSLAAERSAAW